MQKKLGVESKILGSSSGGASRGAGGASNVASSAASAGSSSNVSLPAPYGHMAPDDYQQQTMAMEYSSQGYNHQQGFGNAPGEQFYAESHQRQRPQHQYEVTCTSISK